jgi:hypothetical protein
MFIVMALVTTVATTPLTKALYPPWYQKKVEKWRRGEIDWDGNPIDHSEQGDGGLPQKPVESQIRRLMVHLRLDSLPSLFTFITLLSPETAPVSTHVDATEDSSKGNEIQIRKKPLEVHGLRVIELTDRTSSVMHLTEGEDFYSLRDPVVNAFRTFSQLHDVAVSGRVAVVPADSYAETLMAQASEVSSDFALIPWGEYGSVAEDQAFPIAVSTSERFRSTAHLDFIAQTLAKAAATCNAGIFIDNGFGGITKPADYHNRPELSRTRSAAALSIRSYEPAALPVLNKSHHIFLPFFGGPDDRVAIRIVLQLARNPHVTASIVRVKWSTTASTPSSSTDPKDDNSKARQEQEQDEVFFSTVQASLPAEQASRVVFSEADISSSSSPSNSASSPTAAAALGEIVVLAQKTVGQQAKNAGDVVVLGRNNPCFGGSAVDGGSGVVGGPDLKSTVGPLAERLVTAGIKASLLVVQAGGRGADGY